MKIVQVNATYGIGSTGQIARDIHKKLLSDGNDSYVFWGSSCQSNPDKNVFRIGNTLDHKLHACCWRIFHNQGWNSRLATRAFCRKLARISPDLIHLHNLHSNFINLRILLKFCAKHDIAVAITLHDCWMFTGDCTHFMKHEKCMKWRDDECLDCPAFRHHWDRKRVHKQFLEKKTLFSKIGALGVIGVSNWIEGCGKESLILQNAVHQRIYNWVDHRMFSPRENREEIRNKLGITEHDFLILGVSQGWSNEKGILEFQMIEDLVKNKGKIILVGNQNGYKSSENLIFWGYTKNQSELVDLYNAADLFVNPSRMETFGKVTAEAMACGTPVVAYRNTGTEELLTDQTGYLVEDGDIEKMMAAVSDVLSRDIVFSRGACRQRALEMFDQETLLNEYVDFYKKLLKNS